MASGTEQERFRSFAERYVVERASTFNNVDPRQDAWLAVQDAVSIYDHIAQVGNRYDPAPSAQQAGANAQGPAYPTPVRTLTPKQFPIKAIKDMARMGRAIKEAQWDGLEQIAAENETPAKAARPLLERLKLMGLSKGSTTCHDEDADH